jgi:uncharacterized coiled-coil protein SlyX
MPNAEPERYLKDLDVQFISLVDAGANKKRLIYKSEKKSEFGPTFSKQLDIRKTDEDKHLVYCIVYSPDEVDAHGDGMQAEEIEKAAHNFLFEGRGDQIDKQHDEQPGQGRVVESYITGKSDNNFPNDPEGSWGVAIKVLDEDTWAAVKSGEITGVSMQGWCRAEPTKDAAKGMLKKIMTKLSGQKTEKTFQTRLEGNQLMQGLYAFNEEVHHLMDDEDVDKKAALQSTLNDFQAYLNNINTNNSIKAMSEGKSKKQEETSKEARSEKHQEPEKTVKAVEKAVNNAVVTLQETIEKQSEQLEKFRERLEQVEEASPGSKSQKGQNEQEKAEKGYKGLSMFGGGPNN